MANKGRNKPRTSAKNVLGAATVGTIAAGAGLAAYDADTPNRNKRRREKQRQATRTAKRTKTNTITNQTKTETAKIRLQNLQKINSKDLSTKDTKIKNELIKREKDIIKGLKPPTIAKTAAKIGLRAMPGVGAFLTAFGSTPAGQGSALYGPGSKKK